MTSQPSQSESAKALQEVYRHLRTITAHRDDPCGYWEDKGCQASMVHDADDALRLLSQLPDSLRPTTYD